MGCIMCVRCDKFIDLNYNVEDAITNDQLPGLTKEDYDWVCVNRLTEEEQEKLELQEG